MDKKAVQGSFGVGGPRCPCCNPTRRRRARPSTKLAVRKNVRAARKRAKKADLASWD